MADEIYENVVSPAHEKGMQSGDEILSLNGKEMNDFTDIQTFISTHPDEDIEIFILRNNEKLTFTVHSLLDKETGSGKIGIVSDPNSIIEREYPALPFFPALVEGGKQTWNLVITTIKSLKLLFKGIDVSNAVAGPVRISNMLGETVQQSFDASFRIGIINTLQLLSLISLSLFITNLLPVPILDGGLILVALIETITRKRSSPKLLQNIQSIC